jgi:peptidyl-prolyl cis-trans isomerase B (cyclophilin B)
MHPAEKGLDFIKMPITDLTGFHVVLETVSGSMELEFWPDVAPNHVRNFLDLCHTGFYDGKTFHRVIPGFMIQGGDPKGDGTGDGPRRLKAEFNDRKHVPGVISMARSSDPNSASCQFFIMHKAYPSLDRQYSCFGKLVSGLDVVDRIANVKRISQDKPNEPQRIVKASVVKVTTK